MTSLLRFPPNYTHLFENQINGVKPPDVWKPGLVEGLDPRLSQVLQECTYVVSPTSTPLGIWCFEISSEDFLYLKSCILAIAVYFT